MAVDTGAAPANGRVVLARDGALAFVTLSHPGRLNAISVAMWHAVREIFTTLDADASVRCVVLRGEGGQFAACLLYTSDAADE